MKEETANLRWQTQIISYVALRTNKLIEGQKKTTLADRYNYITSSLDRVGLVTTLPEQDWVEAKPLELLRIYNPETLTWERIDFLLIGILSETFGVYKEIDVVTLAQAIFHRYRSDDNRRTPKPYQGSRYLLFANGVFDAKTRELIPIEKPVIDVPIMDDEPDQTVKIIVPQSSTLEIGTSAKEDNSKDVEDVVLPFVGFSEKHKHFFNLDLKIDNPVFAGTGQNNTWTPEDWLRLTANGNADEAEYLAQILGVMLVPNHSFNAFIEINGQSSGGKTTLINIVSAIYGGNPGVSTGYVMDDLSDRFPFRGTVNRETAFVSITETNGARLQSSGISLINSFANQEMQMKQMGTTSLTLTPPPLLVLEGKGWVLFDSTKTGIARRLLPVDIQNAQTAQYRNTRFGKLVFENPQVLHYFAKRAVLAYADLTKGNDNFMFNLDNVKTLPDFAQKWHTDAVNAGDDQMEAFTERMRDILKVGYISETMLYDLYISSIHFDDPDVSFVRTRRTFKEASLVYLGEYFEIEHINENMRVTNEDNLAIDFKTLNETMPSPDSIKSYGKSSEALYKSRHWLKITAIKDVD